MLLNLEGVRKNSSKDANNKSIRVVFVPINYADQLEAMHSNNVELEKDERIDADGFPVEPPF